MNERQKDLLAALDLERDKANADDIRWRREMAKAKKLTQRDFPCGRCGVKAGEACVSRYGLPKDRQHVERRRALADHNRRAAV